jgi:hypothetical protein
MHRPSKIHNKTEDPLARYRLWEFFIKSADDLLKALAKLGLFSGVVCVLLYILQIRFVPSGLSLGDSIIFIFTALTTGIILVAGSGYAALSYHWFFYLIDGFSNKKWLFIFRRWLCNKFIKEHLAQTNESSFPSLMPPWAQSLPLAIASIIIFLIFSLSMYIHIILPYRIKNEVREDI